jgi:hypothetical protein
MTRILLIALVALVRAVALPAAAEEVCKTAELKNPALTLSEMYARAERDAKAWKADAAPVQIGTTSNGPLQPDGSSTGWTLMFYSDSAKAHVSIDTYRGTYRCWAEDGAAGRIPDLKPDFMRDGAKLYALGKQNGESLLAQGYGVSIGTAAAPGTRHATWYVNFSKPDGSDGGLSVVVNANTGLVEKVLKDD